jgi:hypothetical protein
VGRYVRLNGVLRERRRLREEMFLLRLGGAQDGKQGRRVTAVLFPQQARRLSPAAWPLGQPLHIEGFVQRYRDQPQIVLHYATPWPVQP